MALRASTAPAAPGLDLAGDVVRVSASRAAFGAAAATAALVVLEVVLEVVSLVRTSGLASAHLGSRKCAPRVLTRNLA